MFDFHLKMLITRGGYSRIVDNDKTTVDSLSICVVSGPYVSFPIHGTKIN